MSITTRNYPGNYTIRANGKDSASHETYEVDRVEVDPEFASICPRPRWDVRRHDQDVANDSVETLREAKLAVERWHRSQSAALEEHARLHRKYGQVWNQKCDELVESRNVSSPVGWVKFSNELKD